MSIDKTLNNLMLASMEMLLEAGKQGQSSVEIEFDPAKDFGIDTQKGKFMVIIATGVPMQRLKAAMDSALKLH